MDGRTQELEIGEDDRDKRKSKRSTQPASRQKIVEHWKAGDWRRLNGEMAGWGMRWEAHDKAMASFKVWHTLMWPVVTHLKQVTT